MRRRIDHLTRINRWPRKAAASAALTLLLFAGQCIFNNQASAGDEVHGQPINVSPNASPVKPATGQVTPAGGKKAGVANNAGFDKLAAFRFKVTDTMVQGTGDSLSTSLEISGQIPESVRALNEKQVSITGFMLPLTVNDGKATEFLLLKNQSMCCYGTTPAMNQYIMVRMAGGGVKPVMDRLVIVSGTLHVGEIRQNKLLTGIYRMDGDKVEMPVEP